MDLEKIEELLAERLPDCTVELGSEGNHLKLVVEGACFEGKRAVQRQQLVYGALQELIADGTVHAVHMKTYAPGERS